jgi:glutamate/tyrosine decarboxylase-like PLP-dependent enzyme
VQLTKEEFRRLGYQTVDLAATYLDGIRSEPVYRRMEETERQAILNMPFPEMGVTGDEILRLVGQHLLAHPMGNGHPRFFGWVNSPPDAMAVVTEILAAAMNPSCAGGDHAAIYLEHCVIRWLIDLLSFPAEGSFGLLTSGGSSASLTALAAARHRALRRLGIDVRKRGLGSCPAKLRLYASTQAHSCIQKTVEILGLGSESMRSVDVDDTLRIRLDALSQAIRDDRARGFSPFAIVGNAGTVHTGAVDPLDAVADVAGEHELWLHVDGSYGAAAMVAPATRALFAGIERADSIALDPHKWFSVPVECGCVLVRDGALLRDTFSLVPSYLRTEPGRGIGNLPWFAEYGFQQTRGFRALKLWVTLMHSGKSGMTSQITRQIALARYLERQIEASACFELCAKGDLSIVCFRYSPPELAGNDEAIDRLNQKLMEQVQAGGRAFLTNTTIGGRFVLRACVLHYGTTEADIDELLSAICETAARREVLR